MTSTIQKQPFKMIEVPLSKFSEEAIPHHKQLLEHHKNHTQKLISNKMFDQLNKEIRDKRRTVRQLKDLLFELESLRAQVKDEDLDKFDERTVSLLKTLTGLIKEYNNLQRQASQVTDTQNNINENIENENPFQNVAQIQIDADLEDLKLHEHEVRLKKVEELEGNIQGLQEIYVDLNQMVLEQGEGINVVEDNVEDAQENVQQGLKHLVKASKYKTAAYPVTGALVGTLMGGPVGLIAGFKVGGMAALGCGVAGYAGGKFFKKCNDADVAATENHTNAENEEAESSSPVETESVEKKDK